MVGVQVHKVYDPKMRDANSEYIRPVFQPDEDVIMQPDVNGVRAKEYIMDQYDRAPLEETFSFVRINESWIKRYFEDEEIAKYAILTGIFGGGVAWFEVVVDGAGANFTSVRWRKHFGGVNTSTPWARTNVSVPADDRQNTPETVEGVALGDGVVAGFVRVGAHHAVGEQPRPLRERDPPGPLDQQPPLDQPGHSGPPGGVEHVDVDMGSIPTHAGTDGASRDGDGQASGKRRVQAYALL